MTAIPDPFQVRVAQVALAAAERHGFALGGGHALLAHGLVHRPTEDVDLFTDVDGGVRVAVGPVLHLDDLLGSKVCALATRFEVRDYIDVAAALARGYDRPRLIEIAHEHDPALAEDDLRSAMRRLDGLPDAAFTPYGLDAGAVSELRGRFAGWPR